MPSHKLPILTCLLLGLALAVASLATSITALKFTFNVNRYRNALQIFDYQGRGSDFANSRIYGYVLNLPEVLRLGSLWTIFGCSVVIIVTGLLFAIAGWSPHHGWEGRPNVTRFPLFASFMPAIAAVVAFVYAFVEHYTSTQFDAQAFLRRESIPVEEIGYPRPEAVGERGAWGLEAWSCQTSPVWNSQSYGHMGYQKNCRVASAARWLTIPLLVVSWVLVAVAVVEFVRRRRSGRAEGRVKETEMSPVQSDAEARQ